ncbi:hypothetical protein ACO2I3_01095 [Leptospira interrogans]
MQVFKDVTLAWNGSTFTIPAAKVFTCCAIVEEIMSAQEIAHAITTHDLKLVRFSKAYATALRFAGATVTDEQVYSSLFQGNANDVRQRIMPMLDALMRLMIPPSDMFTQATPTPGPSAEVPAAEQPKAKPRRATKRQ